MEKDFDELEDRRWLGTHKDDVLEEIDRKVEIKDLEDIKQQTNTNRITRKSGELAQALVTEALQGRFQEEIGELGLEKLGIALKEDGGKKGQRRFKVVFTKASDKQIKASTILSEGEFKCVALAAFLAEQATAGSKSAIVFDDPVCSLDHVHREKVAQRLAALGKEQQVIIFTHDWAFLNLFENQKKAEFRCIHKIGRCSNELPFRAKNIKDALDKLEKK